MMRGLSFCFPRYVSRLFLGFRAFCGKVVFVPTTDCTKSLGVGLGLRPPMPRALIPQSKVLPRPEDREQLAPPPLEDIS